MEHLFNEVTNQELKKQYVNAFIAEHSKEIEKAHESYPFDDYDKGDTEIDMFEQYMGSQMLKAELNGVTHLILIVVSKLKAVNVKELQDYYTFYRGYVDNGVLDIISFED